jgi:hypothetical protein
MQVVQRESFIAVCGGLLVVAILLEKNDTLGEVNGSIVLSDQGRLR